MDSRRADEMAKAGAFPAFEKGCYIVRRDGRRERKP
jgi:hypothetical protein